LVIGNSKISKFTHLLYVQQVFTAILFLTKFSPSNTRALLRMLIAIDVVLRVIL
jgi:hypothetical protein